jgi:hypothetical protein
MNLIVVILIVIIIWLVYALLQSYRTLAEKIDEMSRKCIKPSASDTGTRRTPSTRITDPVENMRDTLVGALTFVKNYASIA